MAVFSLRFLLTFIYQNDIIQVSTRLFKQGGFCYEGKNRRHEKERYVCTFTDDSSLRRHHFLLRREHRGTGFWRECGDPDHQHTLDRSGMDSPVRTESVKTTGSSGPHSVWQVCRHLKGRGILFCQSFLYQRESGGKDQTRSERRCGRRQPEGRADFLSE